MMFIVTELTVYPLKTPNKYFKLKTLFKVILDDKMSSDFSKFYFAFLWLCRQVILQWCPHEF